ncbi:MAG: hypothetical protein HOP12_04175, partial [Candidatus Eisenbacteria bacterium]|nr:hypothetical protein [Candidatus Eisenbacteria bacterium]
MDSKGNIYEGKTLEDAVQKGLDAQRMTRAEAQITVMEEGKSGFLGFGARPFRVRVAARPGGAFRETAADGSDRGSRSVRSGRDGGRDSGRGEGRGAGRG